MSISKGNIAVLLIMAMLSLSWFISAFSSEDIDDLCNIDNQTLGRLEGQWQCINLSNSDEINSSIYVPYTGANNNINIGDNTFQTEGADTSYVKLNTDSSIQLAQWNVDAFRNPALQFANIYQQKDDDRTDLIFDSNKDIILNSASPGAVTSITSNLDMLTNKIINIEDPTADQDGATKKYVDDNKIILNSTHFENNSNIWELSTDWLSGFIDSLPKWENYFTKTETESKYYNKTEIDENKISLLDVYPIGSIYISVSATSPETLFGGNWSSIGAGKMLIGLDSTNSNMDEIKETGGSISHTLTTSEMPSHNHALTNPGARSYLSINSGDTGAAWRGNLGGFYYTQSPPTTYTGGGNSFDTISPYLVVYMWERTA